jgi:cell division FtsZ-interacting protein ZapD
MNLDYFINKPITIITNSINRNFNETQSIDYFTGICEKITDMGIFTYHPITKCKNFILFSSMVGIFEEQQVSEDLIKEMNKSQEKDNIIQEDNNRIFIKDNKELDIQSLNNLIKK